MLISFNQNTVHIRGIFLCIATILATNISVHQVSRAKFHPTDQIIILWRTSIELSVIYLFSLFGSMFLVVLSWSKVSNHHLWFPIFAGYCACIDAENAFNTSVAEAIGVYSCNFNLVSKLYSFTYLPVSWL